MNERDKQAAAEAAIEEVAQGMLVGLGTGTTAAFAIAALGRKVAAGLRIDAVATSTRSEALALSAGIRVIDFADVEAVDLTIDGADEIDDRLRAIKGAGGALLREKIVASASTRMVVIADGSKRSARIGRAAVPVEILPFARTYVLDALANLGAHPTLRMVETEAYRTDQGNEIADCAFAALDDPAAFAARLDAIPGVLGHGLFLSEVDAAYIARNGQVARIERPR